MKLDFEPRNDTFLYQALYKVLIVSAQTDLSLALVVGVLKESPRYPGAVCICSIYFCLND